jgi:hypothetical protein
MPVVRLGFIQTGTAIVAIMAKSSKTAGFQEAGHLLANVCE